MTLGTKCKVVLLPIRPHFNLNHDTNNSNDWIPTVHTEKENTFIIHIIQNPTL